MEPNAIPTPATSSPKKQGLAKVALRLIRGLFCRVAWGWGRAAARGGGGIRFHAIWGCSIRCFLGQVLIACCIPTCLMHGASVVAVLIDVPVT